MATFYLVVTKPARHQILELDKADQEAVARLIDIIQLDPAVDVEYKLLFPTREGSQTCYVTPEWRIYYFQYGDWRTVTLKSGATLTLGCSVGVMQLKGQDRAFVLRLLEEMDAFENDVEVVPPGLTGIGANGLDG